MIIPFVACRKVVINGKFKNKMVWCRGGHRYETLDELLKEAPKEIRLGDLIKCPDEHNAEIRLASALLYHCADIYPDKIGRFRRDGKKESQNIESWTKLNLKIYEQRKSFIDCGLATIAQDLIENCDKEGRSLIEYLHHENQAQCARNIETFYLETVDKSPSDTKPDFAGSRNPVIIEEYEEDPFAPCTE